MLYVKIIVGAIWFACSYIIFHLVLFVPDCGRRIMSFECIQGARNRLLKTKIVDQTLILIEKNVGECTMTASLAQCFCRRT